MAFARSSIASGYRQFSNCVGCGRDLTSLYAGAGYCPDCGSPLRDESKPPTKPKPIGWVRSLARHFYRSESRFANLIPLADRTPVVVGYSNALFSLGWRYERPGSPSRNLPEAIRCYRKSARLGNLDAAVRLAVDVSTATPLPVIPLGTQDAENLVYAGAQIEPHDKELRHPPDAS
jgi:hypothetical protein